MSDTVAVIGLGEIGRPLLELIEDSGQHVVGIDVDPVAIPARGTVAVMHICIPFEIDDFVGEVARYIDLIDPRLTIVNSTVAVGTTRAIHERAGAAVAHSPVRGKHVQMKTEMLQYDKFVGGIDEAAGSIAAAHFERLGMRTRVLPSPEVTELAKLTETTYFGLQIAWAQEVERYCDHFQVDYDDVVAIYEEVGYLPPVKFFSGVIGGHCVMPNIDILLSLLQSSVLEAIKDSNERKELREGQILDTGRTGSA
jgi:UDP-N-acetyl-D-mannosaminuronate dehydrogenase